MRLVKVARLCTLFFVSTMSKFSTSAKEQTFDVAIVGGGLSGLYVAELLRASHSVIVLEASDELGGRLKNTEAGFDMGAAWIWPEQGQENVR